MRILGAKPIQVKSIQQKVSNELKEWAAALRDGFTSYAMTTTLSFSDTSAKAGCSDYYNTLLPAGQPVSLLMMDNKVLTGETKDKLQAMALSVICLRV